MKKTSVTRRYFGAQLSAASLAMMMFAFAPQARAQAMKSCEELGGTPGTPASICNLKPDAAPFDITFTGKFAAIPGKPQQGAVFKVTSKFDRPIKIANAAVYAYDKAGKQLDITNGNSKEPYALDNRLSILEIAPGETKELVHAVAKDQLPATMDSLHLEVFRWTTVDGKAVFSRMPGMSKLMARPKDGWK